MEEDAWVGVVCISEEEVRGADVEERMGVVCCTYYCFTTTVLWTTHVVMRMW